jgi:hypothetical protein
VNPSIESLIFLACGVLGGLAKAYLTPEQSTLSRRSFGDVVTAGIVGVVGPASGIIPLPDGWNIVQQGALVAGICYLSSDLATGLLAKFNIAPSPERRP